jgi:hypothetical protein
LVRERGKHIREWKEEMEKRPLQHYSKTSPPEVGKVTSEINSDEALSDESV